MPQTFKIDQAATFEGRPVLLLSCAPKFGMGSSVQDKMKDGTPKWEVQLLGSFSQFGRAVHEVLKIGVASHRDPSEGIAPHTPVELVGLTVGVMEKTKDINGETRVVGVTVWYRADEIRSIAQGSTGRKSESAA